MADFINRLQLEQSDVPNENARPLTRETTWTPEPPQYETATPNYSSPSPQHHHLPTQTPSPGEWGLPMPEYQPYQTSPSVDTRGATAVAGLNEPFQPYYVEPHSIVPHDPAAAQGMQPQFLPTTPQDASSAHARQGTSDDRLLHYFHQMHVLMMNQQSQQTQMLYQMQLTQQRTHGGRVPIIIQNSNEVAASAQQENLALQPKEEDPWAPLWLHGFLRNRANQIVIICGLFVGTYILREKFRHAYRLEQMQTRIDSNIILRMIRTCEDAFGLRRA